jgi:hypothetical protein
LARLAPASVVVLFAETPLVLVSVAALDLASNSSSRSNRCFSESALSFFHDVAAVGAAPTTGAGVCLATPSRAFFMASPILAVRAVSCALTSSFSFDVVPFIFSSS